MRGGFASQSEAQFCPFCDVVLDLHDGPNSCDSADAKARILESFPFGVVR
jgi:hypothetical protein